MPTTYSAEVTKALSTELHDVLADNDVTECVAKFLADKHIVKLGAFADLADSKSNIVKVVGQPAGLDPGGSIACQPLKIGAAAGRGRDESQTRGSSQRRQRKE